MFLKKKHGSKTQLSYNFEKSYNFSCFLRQICHNLVIKKFELRKSLDIGHFQLAVNVQNIRFEVLSV